MATGTVSHAKRMWGVHNDTLTTELLDEGFVSIGWDDLGDLRDLPQDRESLKAALATVYPDDKPRALAGLAGTLLRFRDEMQTGDIVVAPYKPDSTINIGVVSGDYYFAGDEPTHRHRHPVTWRKIGISRTVFSQSTLYEIGALLTVFRVRKHDAEFRAVLETTDTSVEEVTRIVEAVTEATSDEDVPDEPRASRIDRHTRDFVLEALHQRLSHREFEEFTADLLRAMGYEARATAFLKDGGVDVVAHRDALGIEPPLIKVQCKHLTGPSARRTSSGSSGPRAMRSWLCSSHWAVTAATHARANARRAACASSAGRTSSIWCSATTRHSAGVGAHASR